MKMFFLLPKLKTLCILLFCLLFYTINAQTVLYKTGFENISNEAILSTSSPLDGWLTNEDSIQVSNVQNPISGYLNQLRNTWSIIGDSSDIIELCHFMGVSTGKCSKYLGINKQCLGINAYFGNNSDSLLWESYYSGVAVAISGYHDYWTDIQTNRWAYRLIPATDFTDITLSFNWKCAGRHNFDYGQVGYSLDSGKTFTWITNKGGPSNNGQYYSKSTTQFTNMTLPAKCNNQPNLAIGFRFITSNIGGTSWNSSTDFGPAFMIDDLIISGINHTGIEEFNSDALNDISVSPNPANEHFIVNIPFFKDYDKPLLQLYSVENKILLNYSVYGVTSDININSFPAGLYILKIMNKEGVVFKKVFKV